jgi:hypothetical protein
VEDVGQAIERGMIDSNAQRKWCCVEEMLGRVVQEMLSSQGWDIELGADPCPGGSHNT